MICSVHRLVLSFTFFGTFSLAFSQGQHQLDKTCPGCISTPEPFVEADSSKGWESIQLPILMTPELNGLSDLCTDAKKRSPNKKYVLVAFKSHACDGVANECLKAVRNLSDDSNPWLQETFVIYHIRLMSTPTIGPKKELVEFLIKKGFTCDGWKDCVDKEGTLLVVDLEECKVLGGVDDGRRVSSDGRRARLEALNKRIADLILEKKRHVPKPLPIEAKDMNSNPERTIKSIQAATQHQTEVHLLSEIPLRDSDDQKDSDRLLTYLGEQSPLSWNDLQSLRERMKKGGRKPPEPLGELLQMIDLFAEKKEGKIISVPPCYGFYSLWESLGHGVSERERTKIGFKIWRDRLSNGEMVPWPKSNTCSTLQPLKYDPESKELR